jgi:hypothetical protein
MPSVGIETSVSAIKRFQNYALDHTVIGIGSAGTRGVSFEMNNLWLRGLAGKSIGVVVNFFIVIFECEIMSVLCVCVCVCVWSGIPKGGLGVQPTPEIPKLSQISRSVENKSVTT